MLLSSNVWRRLCSQARARVSSRRTIWWPRSEVQENRIVLLFSRWIFLRCRGLINILSDLNKLLGYFSEISSEWVPVSGRPSVSIWLKHPLFTNYPTDMAQIWCNANIFSTTTWATWTNLEQCIRTVRSHRVVLPFQICPFKGGERWVCSKYCNFIQKSSQKPKTGYRPKCLCGIVTMPQS